MKKFFILFSVLISLCGFAQNAKAQGFDFESAVDFVEKVEEAWDKVTEIVDNVKDFIDMSKAAYDNAMTSIVAFRDAFEANFIARFADYIAWIEEFLKFYKVIEFVGEYRAFLPSQFSFLADLADLLGIIPVDDLEDLTNDMDTGELGA